MKKILLFSSFICLCLPLSGQSYEDYNQQEDVLGYEDIVKELTPSGRSSFKSYGTDPLSQVRFHIGVGFANSLMDVQNLDGSIENDVSLNGVQAKLGIDLLSPSWRAEGGLITYETHTDEFGNRYSLKEFDLSLIHYSEVGTFWSYKAGGGLSARYFDFTNSKNEVLRYTTPSMNLQLGMVARFSPKFSVSTDLNYRRAMTKDTADRSAIDLSLRFDGHF